MRKPILILTALAMRPCLLWGGETLEPLSLAPHAGIDVLDRSAARRLLDRDLLSNPYDSVVLARTDVYETFPYVESRRFQIVSDPGWHRLLLGAEGRGLAAYDGAGTPFGALKEPRGLALGPDGLLYVADAGNNRVLVLETRSAFDELSLTPVREIQGLARPFDVAVSDGGTLEDPSDDRIYVVESGRNRVVAMNASGVRIHDEGGLGSGPGRFAGPMAIAATSDRDVYVADAHSRRLVHLRDRGDTFEWVGSREHAYDVVTSLDADRWGNLYIAGPRNTSLAKFSPTLLPIAVAEIGAHRPRSFHVVVEETADHVRGTRTRQGRGMGLLVDDWSDASGIRLVGLGVKVEDLAAESKEGVSARFMLTDRAEVVAEVIDARGGLVARTQGIDLPAGRATLAVSTEDFLAEPVSGTHQLRVTARSRYEEGFRDVAQVSFELAGWGASVRPALLAGAPNPFHGSTEIRFVAPEGSGSVMLRVFDLQGRVVRTLVDAPAASGAGSVRWDGHDNAGKPLGSGVYLARLEVAGRSFTEKMVLLGGDAR